MGQNLDLHKEKKNATEVICEDKIKTFIFLIICFCFSWLQWGLNARPWLPRQALYHLSHCASPIFFILMDLTENSLFKITMDYLWMYTHACVHRWIGEINGTMTSGSREDLGMLWLEDTHTTRWSSSVLFLSVLSLVLNMHCKFQGN
jgi:hypothetical protein